MFGYITVDGDTLDKEEKARYRAAYCGLCRQLGERFGLPGRATLTYDMTFLSLLLGALYNEAETSGILRCPVHPLRKCPWFETGATAYAADLNLLLAYHKADDDWRDEHSPTALAQRKLLAPRAAEAAARWPRQSEAVTAGLRDLSEMERVNELNPDLPTNRFGAMMGELFVRQEDEHAPALRQMGAALGRFIYLMDACMDLRGDIRHQRYNPLTAQPSMDYTPLLTLLISECTARFETLPLARDARILRNILYAGVWVQYNSRREARSGEASHS